MTKLTDDELRKLDAEATKGPWPPFENTIMKNTWESYVALCIRAGTRAEVESYANARLIAAARDLPAEVLELRAALRGLIAFKNWELAEGGVTPPALEGVWKAAESALGVRQ